MRLACRRAPLLSGVRVCPVLQQYLPAHAAGPVGAGWRSAAAQRETRVPQPLQDARRTGAPARRVRSAALEHRRFMSIDKYSLFGGAEAGEQRTSVDSYNKHGFMVNGVLIQGAVILLPETTLLWNVTKMEDISSESLVALRLLRTKPGLPRRTPAPTHESTLFASTQPPGQRVPERSLRPLLGPGNQSQHSIPGAALQCQAMRFEGVYAHRKRRMPPEAGLCCHDTSGRHDGRWRRTCAVSRVGD